MCGSLNSGSLEIRLSSYSLEISLASSLSFLLGADLTPLGTSNRFLLLISFSSLVLFRGVFGCGRGEIWGDPNQLLKFRFRSVFETNGPKLN